jgi:hypothetical protein
MIEFVLPHPRPDKKKGNNIKMALIDALLNKYILVKTQSSGCFAGYLKAKEDNEVILTNCRRL